jgi:steroid delta-isomerase-like uncharacterized protein
MTPEKMKPFIEQHIDAFARGDWNAYRAQLTESAIYEEEATGQRCEGAETIVSYVRRWKEAFPDVKGKIKNLFVSGDAAICELEWTGKHEGPLEGPMGRLEPTGRSARVPAVQVLRFEGDRIGEMHHYFDMMTLLGQLGALPAGPGAEAAQQAPTAPA